MPVLGVDVGSFTSTVATISKGAIDVVLNDVSQRYTPTCVTYGELQRIFGDQANTQIVSNFRNTCRGFFNLLGLSLNSDTEDQWIVTELDKFFSSTPLILDEKGQLSYQITNSGKTHNVSILSVLIGYLGYLTNLAEKYTGGICREVVMSYPIWFSEYQKNMLVTAIKASGSNCLRLISEGFAMAMDYGMYRLKQLTDETATTVVLVNIGHSHTTVAVVDFFASYCVLLSEMSDRELGGRYLEYLLMNEMCKEFNKKYQLDPLNNNKTKLKVEAIASKVKRVLSANSESSYSLECLMEDYDLNGNVKRDDFEKLCSTEFLPRLSELLMCVLKMSGRSLESIHSVEVVGGITRVPCVQSLISQVFKKPVSKTLNSDESVSRGCVLQGAINSKHYMVRKYNVVEKLSKPITVCCLPGLGPFSQQQLNNADRIPIATVGTGYNEIYVLRVGMEPPFTILTSFEDPRLNSKNQLPTYQYTLSYNLNNNIFQSSKDKDTKLQNINNSNQQDKKIESKNKDNNDNEDNNMSDVDEYLNKMDKEFNEENQENNNIKVDENNKDNKNEYENNNKNINTFDRDKDGSWIIKFQFDDTANLLSYCKGLDVCLLNPFKFDLEQLTIKESEQNKKDLHETDRLKTLNDLETYVYTIRDKLQTTHKEFIDNKNLNQLQTKLDETENWLYENRGTNLDNLIKKYNNLKLQFEQIENNYKIYIKKQQELDNFFTKIKQLYQYTCGTEQSWINIPEEERSKITYKLNQLNNNTMELIEKENNIPKYNKPLFTMEQIEQELKNITDEMDQLVKKYKVIEKENNKDKEIKEPKVEEPEDIKMDTEEDKKEEQELEENNDMKVDENNKEENNGK